MARRNVLTKLGVGLGAVLLVGYLFARTLTTVGSTPYVVPDHHLGPWTVELGRIVNPSAPAVILRPPRPLAMGVFDQVFQRTMESYTSPAVPGIPLVLYRELGDTGLARGSQLVEELKALAEELGVASTRPSPDCMAVYRTEGGREQRLFFLLFEHPPFGVFRTEVGSRLRSIGEGLAYRAEALAPAMLIATSDARRLGDVHSRAELKPACEAPISVE